MHSRRSLRSHFPNSDESTPGVVLANCQDGRALASLKENSTVSPSTGSMNVTVPIYTSPSRGNVEPSLVLSYSHGVGNGPFGLGWKLNLDSVTRDTSKLIPRYEDANDSDSFVLTGLDTLVAVREADRLETVGEWNWTVRRYSPRIQAGEPVRIERWENTQDEGDVHWRSISADNITSVYGRTDESRILDSAGPRRRIFSWLICEQFNALGDDMRFEYKHEDGLGADQAQVPECGRGACTQRYLKRILYGNRVANRRLDDWIVDGNTTVGRQDFIFEVVLDYGEHDEHAPSPEPVRPWSGRREAFSTHSAGFEIRTHHLCRRVLVFHHFPQEFGGVDDTLVSSTRFEYNETSFPDGTALLSSIAHAGHAPGLGVECMPPQSFGYIAPQDLSSCVPNSINGIDDRNLRGGASGPDMLWVDLDGEGSPGLLNRQEGGAWWYQRNESPEFAGSGSIACLGPAKLLKVLPGTPHEGWAYLSNVGGDSNRDLDYETGLCSAGARGYYTRTEEGGWVNFIPFSSLPNVNLDDSHVLMVDLTGDGNEDILVLGGAGGWWYPSLGKGGFGEQKSLSVGLVNLGMRSSDPLSRLCCADMTGDGLADLVYIEEGRLSYWPNQGYGKFGRRIEMGGNPLVYQRRASPSRLCLADVTGSGTADLIQLTATGQAVVYYNCSGNHWSTGHPVPAMTGLIDLDSVVAIDLLGQGTACLCWKYWGAGLRYIDLMGGRRPGLMETYTNGLGLETRISYCPSTKYYLDDERAGRPWTTRLPFPVQCVERIVTADLIAKLRHLKRYAYHNGYYDKAEREFRGFEMAEQWEEEAFGEAGASNSFCKPVVHHKTWFHLGRWSSSESFLYARHRLLSNSEAQLQSLESARALKGLPAHHEIYSGDEMLPYMSVEQNYEVRLVQRNGSATGRGPPVYRVLGRERLTCQFERSTVDEASLVHELTLQSDSYGRPTKSASIAYGRTVSSLSHPGDRARQETSVITYSEADYTNAIDDGSNWRAPVICETRRYRLVGAEPQQSRLYDYVTLTANGCAFFSEAAEGYLNDNGSSTTPRKILLSKERVYYRSADLTARLPCGKIEVFSVLDQVFKLAVSSEELSGALARVLPQSDTPEFKKLLTETGGYQDLDNNGCWWIPSSRSRFSTSSDAAVRVLETPSLVYTDINPRPDSQDELAAARREFYTPAVHIDPFGARTCYEFDAYYLLPVSLVDAMQNKTTFVNDYAVLTPRETIDPNGNHTRVCFDALRRVVGKSVQGKDGEAVGDSLDGFRPQLTEAEMEEFMAKPLEVRTRSVLGNAGQRIIYGTRRFWQTQSSDPQAGITPSFWATITRHSHGSASTALRIEITYLGGDGRPIQEASYESGSGMCWRVSGWQVRDAQGQSVRQMMPFLASSHAFCFQPDSPSIDNLSSTVLRDPLGRPVVELERDHSWCKTIFGPWAVERFGAGDTVLVSNPTEDADVASFFKCLDPVSYLPTWYARTSNSEDPWERDSAEKSKLYANTPTVVHLDALGRPILRIKDNGGGNRYAARVEYDWLGNQSRVQNEQGTTVSKAVFDRMSRVLYRSDMDSGERWFLHDCLGRGIFAWDARGMRKRFTYDALGRPLEDWLLEGSSAEEVLTTRYVYGEGIPDASKTNSRGRLSQCYDQAGWTQYAEFDFKGNCTKMRKKVAKDYRNVLNWSPSSSNSKPPELEDGNWGISRHFNALNKCWWTQASDGSVTTRSYKSSGKLAMLGFTHAYDNGGSEVYISGITYSADGHRKRIGYGNGVIEENSFHDDTRELARSRLRKVVGSRRTFRDIRYTYDCERRRTHQHDTCQQSVYFRNNNIEAIQDFTYDAIGQITASGGRERLEGGRRLQPYSSTYSTSELPGDGEQMCVYIEKYTYDAVGNILSLSHAARNDPTITGWAREYHYDDSADGSKSNRLSYTRVGLAEERYSYNEHGCMTCMPGYSSLTWDFNDRLWSSSRQVANEGALENTWYKYDANGKCTHKVTELAAPDCTQNPTKIKETVYFPGFQIHRTFADDGNSPSEKLTSLVLEDDSSSANSAVALIEYCPATQTKLIRYQVAENLELDHQARVVSYAEYSPFGAVTFDGLSSGLEAPKQYRYAHYERDPETGLFRCGERGYAAWLGRWTSPDPLGLWAGLNRYQYVGNDPVNWDDPRGTIANKKAPRGTEAKAGTSSRTRAGQGHEQRQAHAQDVRGAGPATTLSSSHENIIYLYRGTTPTRAQAFLRASNPDQRIPHIETKAPGDFNYVGYGTAYLSVSETRAWVHAKEGGVVMQFHVPASYFDEARADDRMKEYHADSKWFQRVIADRLEMPPETLKRMRGRDKVIISEDVVNDILDSREKEITYGPGIRNPTDSIVQNLQISATRIEANQYAFRGQALRDLAQMQVTILQAPSSSR